MVKKLKLRPYTKTARMRPSEMTTNGFIVSINELNAAALEARALASGLVLATVQYSLFTGDRASVVMDWQAVALLVDRARE